MDTEIRVTEDVRVVGSGVDWCVESRHVAEKSGKVRWDFEGSYASATKALQSLVDGRNAKLLTGHSEPLSLPDFIEKVERAVRVIAVAVKRAGVGAPPPVSAAPSR